MSRCTKVAGAVATGTPLTDEERAHVETCADCAALVELPTIVARSARAAEPGPGFSARMQVGARARLATRRRRRTAVGSIAAAAAAAALFLGVHRVRENRRPPAEQRAAAQRITSEESTRARELLDQTGFDRAMAPVAPWDEIEAPLDDYRAILENRHDLAGDPP